MGGHDNEGLTGGVTLTATSPRAPEAQALIADLDASLRLVYPETSIHGLHDEDFNGDRFVLLVARSGGGAVGCGGLRSLDDAVAEVKRMYVVPAWRGRGLARRILAAIEALAVGRGHTLLRLETGKRQIEALSLYRSSGFNEIPLYGEYVSDPFSVCFEKKVTV